MTPTVLWSFLAGAVTVITLEILGLHALLEPVRDLLSMALARG